MGEVGKRLHQQTHPSPNHRKSFRMSMMVRSTYSNQNHHNKRHSFSRNLCSWRTLARKRSRFGHTGLDSAPVVHPCRDEVREYMVAHVGENDSGRRDVFQFCFPPERRRKGSGILFGSRSRGTEERQPECVIFLTVRCRCAQSRRRSRFFGGTDAPTGASKQLK